MWQKTKMIIKTIWLVLILFVGFNGVSEIKNGENHKATLSLLAAVCMFNVLEECDD